MAKTFCRDFPGPESGPFTEHSASNSTLASSEVPPAARILHSPDRLRRLTPSHLSFTGSSLLGLKKPCIYFWWRRDLLLYIGCSVNGLFRVLDPVHHQLRHSRISSDDHFDVWFFSPDVSLSELQTEESRLIGELRPALNETRGTPPTFRRLTETEKPLAAASRRLKAARRYTGTKAEDGPGGRCERPARA